MRILLVDDDDILIQALASQLTAHHYAVDLAIDGEAGWNYAQSAFYDLIVLDVDLPKLDGVQLCQKLRQHKYNNPILLLTARGGSSDKVIGLDAGADDYVVKPCTIEELCARIRALLRRRMALGTPVLEWGDLRLNPATCEVVYREQLLTLSPKEYGVLELFLRSPQRIFSSNSILEHLWGFDNTPGEETVRTHIKRLRRKLKLVGASNLIDTVYGMGYRLKPVVELDASTARSTADQARTSAIALWDKFKPHILERLVILDQAAATVETGFLPDDLRQDATKAAHKLIGSLGMFGFPEGSRLSGEIEHWLETAFGSEATSISETTSGFETAFGSESAAQLQTLVKALRQELQHPPIASSWHEDDVPLLHERRVSGQVTTTLLIVNDDVASTQSLQTEATRRGMQVNVIPGTDFSRIVAHLPDVLLLDLPFPQQSPAGLALLEELTAEFPNLPVLVLTESNELSDRLTVAQHGGYRFITRSTPLSQVLDAAQNAVNYRRSPKVTVLIVDDDPIILNTLQQFLPQWGIDPIPLSDPRQIWNVLETALPDLLILDIDMPHINGIDLCRVIRSDNTWNNLPILFLSAQRDAETVVQLYSAGADDYITKPFTEPEVVTRIFNRLERQRMLRSLAETDPLTGVSNRHQATQDLNRYLSLAQRYAQPLCLAVVDLDHFKQINDCYGHEVGDTVLKRMAKILQQTFREQDVVARWGGEEFLIGMYSMNKQQALKRLNRVLQIVRQERVWVASVSKSVQVTFSAGVSEAPEDGLTLHSLCQAADAAMYQAKARGRNCVVLALPLEESSPPEA